MNLAREQDSIREFENIRKCRTQIIPRSPLCSAILVQERLATFTASTSHLFLSECDYFASSGLSFKNIRHASDNSHPHFFSQPKVVEAC